MKAAIVLGVIGVIVAGMAWMGVPPFKTDRDDSPTSQQRGIGG